MALEKLFSVRAAAKKLGGLSPWTVYSWLADGRLKGLKIGGRRMISESELARFIEQGKGAGSAEQDRT